MIFLLLVMIFRVVMVVVRLLFLLLELWVVVLQVFMIESFVMEVKFGSVKLWLWRKGQSLLYVMFVEIVMVCVVVLRWSNLGKCCRDRKVLGVLVMELNVWFVLIGFIFFCDLNRVWICVIEVILWMMLEVQVMFVD